MSSEFPRRRRRRSLLLVSLSTLAVAGLGLVACQTPRPTGTAGSGAEQLADDLLEAIDADAWDRTRALRWHRNDPSPPVLWDRDRELAELLFDGGALRVLYDVRGDRAVAFRDGVRLEGEALDAARKKGRRAFFNETFWLAAPMKVRDDGTTRKLVEHERRPALLVSYASGGDSPGDAYLWELDENGRPAAWRIWAQRFPIKGIRFGWEDWRELSTGAWAAHQRVTAIYTIEYVSIEGAASLSELVGDEDPFAPLLP